MRRFFIACLITLLFVKCSPQNHNSATLRINVANTTPFKGVIYLYDASPKLDIATKGEVNIVLDKNQSASFTIQLTKPESRQLIIYTSFNKAPVSYTLYLSPGDDISYTVDFSKSGAGVVVTGKGSENNQPAIAPLTDVSMMFAFAGDTTPYRMIAAINKQYGFNKRILESYISTYHPSAAFIKNEKLNLAYFSPLLYYSYKENNKFGLPEGSYKRNMAKWQKVQDSLFASVAPSKYDGSPANKYTTLLPKSKFVNNDSALSSHNFTTLIAVYAQREKEKAWDQSEANPVLFYRQWYGTDSTTGKKIFAEERKNLFVEKVIDKYFTGKTAEYLHARLITNNFYESNYQNIGTLFEHFKQHYPNSVYTESFTAPVAAVSKRQNQPLTEKMVFVADNGSKLNTLNDVISANKGKTVFVDMWGTWCGPCREEIEQNSAALREHFKGKDVDFLYIANNDLANEKAWKSLIAYFNMEGTHILANENLTKDISDKIKLTGFPTYFIIKKDGSYQQTKVRYPINREALEKEIELAAN